MRMAEDRFGKCPGACSGDLFMDEGTHHPFETCLFEACEECGWVLEGVLCDAGTGEAIFMTKSLK